MLIIVGYLSGGTAINKDFFESFNDLKEETAVKRSRKRTISTTGTVGGQQMITAIYNTFAARRIKHQS